VGIVELHRLGALLLEVMLLVPVVDVSDDTFLLKVDFIFLGLLGGEGLLSRRLTKRLTR